MCEPSLAPRCGIQGTQDHWVSPTMRLSPWVPHSLTLNELSDSPTPSQDDSLSSSPSLNERPPKKNPKTENGVVIYRSPRSGRGLDEADVTVRPGWPGLPWGPPFLGGISAMQGSPPTHACPDSPKRYCTKILPRKARGRYCGSK